MLLFFKIFYIMIAIRGVVFVSIVTLRRNYENHNYVDEACVNESKSLIENTGNNR